MASICIIFWGVFIFYFHLVCYNYFGGVIKKTVLPLTRHAPRWLSTISYPKHTGEISSSSNHLGEGSGEKNIILMVTDVRQPALSVDHVTINNLRNLEYSFSYPRQQLRQC